MVTSIRIGREDLAAPDRIQADPDNRVDGVLDEVDGAVAEAGVHAAGMPAARAGVEVEERERDGHAGQILADVVDAESVAEPVAAAARRVRRRRRSRSSYSE